MCVSPFVLQESVIELRNVLEVDAWITTNNQLLRLSMTEDEDEEVGPGGDCLYHKLPSMTRMNTEDADMEDNFIEGRPHDEVNGNGNGNGNGVAFGLKRLSLSVSASQLLPPSSPTIIPLVLPALSLLGEETTEEYTYTDASSPSLISRLMRSPSPSSSSPQLSRESSGSTEEGGDVIITTDVQSLPDWVFEQILLLLGARTTAVCSVVCRHWNKICKSENVWREFVKWDFTGHVIRTSGSWDGFHKARHVTKARKVIKEIDVVLGSLKGYVRTCSYMWWLIIQKSKGCAWVRMRASKKCRDCFGSIEGFLCKLVLNSSRKSI